MLSRYRKNRSSRKNIYNRSGLIRLMAVCLLLPGLTALEGCASAPPLESTKGLENPGSPENTEAADLEENPEDNINRYEIVIPGMTGDYDLLFLTDTHIAVSDDKASSRVRDYTQQRLSLFINESGGTDPSARLPFWISYANETGADALLLGGDIIDSPSSSNLEYIGSCLEELDAPYLYTLGNHDWTFPWEYMTEKGAADYLPLFAPYMGENTAIHTLELEECVIAAVDNSSNQINPAALEEYKRILAGGRPVILLLHVPLYTQTLLEKTSGVWNSGVLLGGGIHGGIYPNEVSAEFIRLTTAADSPVAAVLAGHVHLEDYSNLEGEKEIPQITGDAGYKGKAALLHITG